MAEQIDDGGPAFAALATTAMGDIHHQPGMSLRDWFAGLAFQGILAGPCSREGASLSEWADIPEHAYKLADLMLKARSKSGASS